MKKLIVNADDYGLTPAVSKAIRHAHLHGIVTSTTCMMNIPYPTTEIGNAIRETPRLGLGVHLVLTAQKPLLPAKQVPSLVDENGKFLKIYKLIEKLPALDIQQVKAEWRAQIETFISVSERKPTHLDSHHHSSYFSPELLKAMLELAGEFECAIRLPVLNKSDWTITGLPEEVTLSMQKVIGSLINEFQPASPEHFSVEFYDEMATSESLNHILNSLRDGTSEIMSHPGYNDAELLGVSGYNYQRETELRVLIDAQTLAAVERHRIQLVNFGSL